MPQLDSLADAGLTRVFSEKISTRATRRPELEAAVRLAGELKGLSPLFWAHVNPYGRFEGDSNAHLQLVASAAAARVPGPRPAPGAPTAQPTGRWAGSV
ncbi:hypothetical protein ABT104_20280 [Streptomyces mobaraensis]|uniref:hypothetical protein n=1 Tax=Streptomyces mobaraensis TaxID=35621 RepID=UPI00332F4D9B